MRYLLCFLLLFPITGKTQCLQMDIILLVDVSGSVKGDSVFIQEAIEAFVNRFDLSKEGIRIGVVTFAEQAFVLSPLSSKTKQNLYNIRIGDYMGGQTVISNGIAVCNDEFHRNGREDVKRMLIVISDGDTLLEYETIGESSRIKEIATVCSIIIQNKDTNTELMQRISSDCFMSSSYEMLLFQLQTLNICL